MKDYSFAATKSVEPWYDEKNLTQYLQGLNDRILIDCYGQVQWIWIKTEMLQQL